MSKKWLMMALVICSVLAGCAKAKSDPEDYVTLGQYKGLSVERLNTEVTDNDVDAEFESRINLKLENEKVTDRNDVRDGDIVNIDFVGKLNGEAFEGGTSKGFDLTIGSGTFINGFEDGLIGAKVGDDLALDLTFPEYYPNNESLAGQPVVFEVTVNSISCKPEITDSVVEKVTDGEFKTIEAYKDSIKESLETSAVEYADSAMYIDLWQQAVDNATVKSAFPEEILQEKVEKMKKNAQSYADSYNVDLATYLKQWMNMSLEQFDKEIDDYAETAAKESYVLMAISNTEGITVSDEELDKAINEYVELYKYDSREEFEKSVDLDDFKEYILLSKVKEFLGDEAVITVVDNKAK